MNTKYLALSLIVIITSACVQAPIAPQPTTEPTPKVEVTKVPETTPPAPVTAPTPEQPIVPTPAAAKKEDNVLLGGLLYIGLQNWSRVGTSGDSKMGFGLGGDFFVGMRIDDLTVYAGPHFSFNQWSADYSDKPNSATDSVYVNMSDAGANIFMDFGDTYFHIGAGSSTISSAMTVSGQEIEYAYSGNKYSYKAFGIGMQSGSMLFGLAATQYDGYARYADRVEFNFGWAFF